MPSSRISGRVTGITESSITVLTEYSNEIDVPRYMGISPQMGQAVVLDLSMSYPQIYPAQAIAKLSSLKRYLNFYAISGENTVPEPTAKGKADANGVGQEDKYGQTSQFFFADTQLGLDSVKTGNGNIAFAGPTAAGIATSCESKVIARDNGTVEIVTPHLMALYGSTIVIDNFSAGIHIEIDITTARSAGGAGDIEAAKKSVVSMMSGDEEGGSRTYEMAFADLEADPFIKMFGLHLGELLLTFQWSRLLFRGQESVFHEVFDKYGTFDSVYAYCGGCAGENRIKSMEFFLMPGAGNLERAHVPIPPCSNASSDILQINGFFNGEEYSIFAMNIVMSDGGVVEYSANKKTYSLEHGIIAKKSFVSSDYAGVYSNAVHVNVDSIAIPEINISSSTPGYCGGSVGIPSLTWGGDMTISVMGSFTVSATEDATVFGGSSAIIGGGTRGIRVDSTGSSAITL